MKKKYGDFISVERTDAILKNINIIRSMTLPKLDNSFKIASKTVLRKGMKEQL